MGWYGRRGRWGGQYSVYRPKRDNIYCRKKVDYDIKANDKLTMLGILFMAGFRNYMGKGVLVKELKIFLEEDPEKHDYLDKKTIQRTYYKISMERGHGIIYATKFRERSRRKSQTVRV